MTREYHQYRNGSEPVQLRDALTIWHFARSGLGHLHFCHSSLVFVSISLFVMAPAIEPSHFARAEYRMNALCSGSKPVSLFDSVTHSESGGSVKRA